MSGNTFSNQFGFEDIDSMRKASHFVKSNCQSKWYILNTSIGYIIWQDYGQYHKRIACHENFNQALKSLLPNYRTRRFWRFLKGA